MRAQEVLRILQITRPTLCKYVKTGIIKVTVKGKLDTIEGGAFGEYYDTISVYFMGGAPENVSPADDYPSFTTDNECEITLYYVDDGSWEFDANGLWNGYELTEIKVIDSGYCGAEGDGTNLNWMIIEDGTLTISGEGTMASYNIDWNIEDRWGYTDAPWREYADIVTTLVLEEGITEIGNNAFRGMVNIEGTINLPSTLNKIGSAAFYACTGIKGALVIPEGVISIGQSAFVNCYNLNGKLVLPKSITEIGGKIL